ncbi:MAG TPA: 2OG-Fe(II) oxygenase [Chthoniobacterales bacterium]|nr:2OG-Fe(II) oxygenase [Chthoniobacterales bacterium]
MISTAPLPINESIHEAVAQQDEATLRREYSEQDEFVVIPDFLPASVLEQWEAHLPAILPQIHRNYLPGHKKGGSVPYDILRSVAPAITEVYHSAELLAFLRRLVGAEMNECPTNDPHRCAFYAYTEEGDHMGFHYDTSYYKDRRWTLLVGFKDDSSSRLECHLHTRQPGRAVEKLELKMTPGMLVLFNGDKVYHQVTPVKAGETRYVVSMQFVTSGDMNPFMRFISNMKDAVAYFGLRGVFTAGKRNSNGK